MCILNWCYKHFRKSPDDGQVCVDKTDSFDESLIICDAQEQHSKCVCKELPEKRVPMLQNQTVNVCYYPIYPSSETSSKRASGESAKMKGSAATEKSIALSHTTSSSMPISFQSESEETTEETNDTDDGEDYEIQFSDADDEEVEEEEETDEDHACDCGEPVPCECEDHLSERQSGHHSGNYSEHRSGSDRRSEHPTDRHSSHHTDHHSEHHTDRHSEHHTEDKRSIKSRKSSGSHRRSRGSRDE